MWVTVGNFRDNSKKISACGRLKRRTQEKLRTFIVRVLRRQEVDRTGSVRIA
jgi:hypothetical protein